MSTTRAKVFVTDFIECDLNVERAVLNDLADVTALHANSEAEVLEVAEQADALMVYHIISLTEHVLKRLRRCKLIVRCGVGFDNVNGRVARELGIPLVNVPDYGTEEVADTAIGMMLTLTRGIHFLNSRLRNCRQPWHYSQAVPLGRLRGRTFGIVGCGRIGTAVALRAKTLGMDVAFYDPYAPDGRDKALGIRRVESLEQLLRESHVVSLHCPLTPETYHLINAATLECLPAGAYLINTARGGVVDWTCLEPAIVGGRLAGAGIDVLEVEPPPESLELLAAWRDPSHPAHDRLILNPHAAFYSEEGLQDMRRKGSEACRRALLGLPLRNVVN